VTVEILARHHQQVRHVADDFVMVRMHTKGRLLDGLAQHKEGLVLVTFAL
jgi:hypothetical protein